MSQGKNTRRRRNIEEEKERMGRKVLERTNPSTFLPYLTML
jgi:hypothetical protein